MQLTQRRLAHIPQLTQTRGPVIAESFIADSLSVSVVRLGERHALDDLVHILYLWLFSM